MTLDKPFLCCCCMTMRADRILGMWDRSGCRVEIPFSNACWLSLTSLGVARSLATWSAYILALPPEDQLVDRAPLPPFDPELYGYVAAFTARFDPNER